MRYSRRISARVLLATVAIVALITACGSPSASPPAGTEPAVTSPIVTADRLRVVATTNIVGDVVAEVGQETIDLTVLLGIGVDPHTYVARPGDVAAVHDADVVFANGAGLEEWMGELLENAGGNATVVYVSDGLDLRMITSGQSTDADPHVWFSVPNVIHWVQQIETTLSAEDPANASAYAAQAQAYGDQLEELDRWIQEQVAAIPESRRLLVTDHPTLAYFADRYGFQVVGTIYPFNPSAEPSAQHIAALENTIRELEVSAIFTEPTVSTRLAEQVAQDTGMKVVQLYTGSLGAPGSDADTYIMMMRYNVTTIVNALQD